MRHNKLLLFVILCLLLVIPISFADNKNLTITVFYGDGCPHCADEKEFLNKIQEKYPNLKIHYYEVWYNKTNADYFIQYAREKGVEPTGIPYTFINNYSIVGYFNDETTGKEIEEVILKHNGEFEIDQTIKFPFVGEVNLKALSLPALTVVLATLDGFNPCAMWVLMFLLALLINTRSRKKILLIGGTFIGASGIVYYMFMAAWLNAFLWLEFVEFVRILIGTIAIGAGFYFLYGWYTFVPGLCKTTSPKLKSKIIKQMHKVVTPAIMPATFLGVIFLAFSVNLIELICSLGLPAIYTKILIMSSLPKISYYLYLFAYTLIYMVDDFIIFLIAVKTMQAIGFSGKYYKWVRLIGGLLILFLGVTLILRPDLLMFG